MNVSIIHDTRKDNKLIWSAVEYAQWYQLIRKITLIQFFFPHLSFFFFFYCANQEDRCITSVSLNDLNIPLHLNFGLCFINLHKTNDLFRTLYYKSDTLFYNVFIFLSRFTTPSTLSFSLYLSTVKLKLRPCPLRSISNMGKSWIHHFSTNYSRLDRDKKEMEMAFKYY